MNMLQRLSKAVNTELPADEYPADSAERKKAKTDAFESTGLAKRLDTLARYVLDGLPQSCEDTDLPLRIP